MLSHLGIICIANLANHRSPRLFFRCTARNALFRLNLFPEGSWRVGYRIEARKGNRK